VRERSERKNTLDDRVSVTEKTEKCVSKSQVNIHSQILPFAQNRNGANIRQTRRLKDTHGKNKKTVIRKERGKKQTEVETYESVRAVMLKPWTDNKQTKD
jgi:hypothetical protein